MRHGCQSPDWRNLFYRIRITNRTAAKPLSIHIDKNKNLARQSGDWPTARIGSETLASEIWEDVGLAASEYQSAAYGAKEWE